MTQADLATQVGVHESTVTAWESGKHFPRRYQGKIEAVLGISLDLDGVEVDPGEQELRDLVTGVLPDAEVRQWIDRYRAARRDRRRAG